MALDLELRDIRSQSVPLDDHPAVQSRQRRLLRLNQALTVIRAFALKKRLSV